MPLVSWKDIGVMPVFGPDDFELDTFVTLRLCKIDRNGSESNYTASGIVKYTGTGGVALTAQLGTGVYAYRDIVQVW